MSILIAKLTDKASCPCPLAILPCIKVVIREGFLLINAGHHPHHHHLLPFAEELVMDLKYHNSYLCVSPLWTWALHRQDEGVGGLIIIWPCVNSYHCTYVCISARLVCVGVVSWCPLFRSEFILESHIGSWSFVRSPETRSIRFLEVAYVLQSC